MDFQPDPLPYIPHERRFFGREVLGILEALAAVLIFIALFSTSLSDDQWAGAMGAWTANGLTFLFGRFVSFVVPVMLLVDAWNTLSGWEPFAGKLRSWLRVSGAILLLLSACALLTFHVDVRTNGDAKATFEAGGLIGSFMIDSRGLNLTRFLGHAGALVTFYGLATVGLVLFTETLIRELGQGVINLLIRVLPGHWIPYVVQMPRRFKYFLIDLFRIRGILDFINGICFRPSHSAMRVFDAGPIRLTMPAAPRRRSPAPKTKPPKPKRRRRKREPEPLAPESMQRETFGRVFPPGYEDARSDRALQPELELFPANYPANYELPSLDILAEPPKTNYRMSESEAERLSRRIEETLAQFRIEVEVTEVVQGPVVTRFALHVAPGIRVNKILALENDMALALRAQHVRILAPIPGQGAVGIEVPNKRTNPVMLKELMESSALERSKSALSFGLGKNIAGETVIADLAQMPHILIAGATGSGKSVCLNVIIASILFRNPPDRVKFVMIDPKRVELSVYQAIPHLLAPVVSEPRKAASALAWTVEQMESRYKLLAEVSVRNIDGYNAIVNDRKPNRKAMGRDMKFMPQIVVVIDELADLMLVAKNEVEEYVIRLAQMARAVGIHLIVATQRPSVNVITGIIKANFPTRIAFRVSSKVDSRTILDMNGAESLLGRGDMLYSPGGVKPFRIQGAFVSDAEIENLADTIRAQERVRYEKEDFEAHATPSQRAKAQLMRSALGGKPDEEPDELEAELERRGAIPTRGRAGAVPLKPAEMETLTDQDLFDVALKLILESRKASVSYIQRRLKIGYARAGRIMDMMEDQGIVGPYQGSKPRDIIVDPIEFMAARSELEI